MFTPQLLIINLKLSLHLTLLQTSLSERLNTRYRPNLLYIRMVLSFDLVSL